MVQVAIDCAPLDVTSRYKGFSSFTQVISIPGRGLFWADTGQYVHVENSSKAARKNARLGIDIDLRCHAFVQEGSDGKWWTPPDLNRWPPGYEPGALTRLS